MKSISKKYSHIAPFGRDCFNCGKWLTNEENLLRQEKRPVYDEWSRVISFVHYMIYQCPDCGRLMRNQKVTIYD